jgi:hypothetical protein
MTARTAILAAALVLAGSGSARAQYYAPPPATPPALCRSSVFVDVVGTAKRDTLRAFSRATRVWGLGGADRLLGSATRASCLLGGLGNDVMQLNAGGGLALGEQGRDAIAGSSLGDVIVPGPGVDGVGAGGGDDKITTRDHRAELIDCGGGDDIVKADRRDILVGCESVNTAGPAALRLSPSPARISSGGLVRVRLTVPRAAGTGAYRLLYVTTSNGRSCDGGPVEITRFPAAGARVRRGQHVRIGLRHPAGGWCRGSAHVVVVRSPGQALPVVGVARFSFTVR